MSEQTRRLDSRVNDPHWKPNPSSVELECAELSHRLDALEQRHPAPAGKEGEGRVQQLESLVRQVLDTTKLSEQSHASRLSTIGYACEAALGVSPAQPPAPRPPRRYGLDRTPP